MTIAVPARSRFTRTNFAGRPVSLLEGPLVVAGLASGLALVGQARRSAYVVAAGALGALDDHLGSASSKGLRGHLRALSRGEATTGAVKLAGLVVLAAAEALALEGERPGSRRPVSIALDVVVVAGCANLINLFDLRPGRALKVTIAGVAAPAMRADPTAIVTLAVCACAAPGDLAGRTMLGDTGANALGFALGGSLAGRTSLPARCVIAALVTGLTLASERVSFSRVIESQPLLRAIDQCGRP